MSGTHLNSNNTLEVTLCGLQAIRLRQENSMFGPLHAILYYRSLVYTSNFFIKINKKPGSL